MRFDGFHNKIERFFINLLFLGEPDILPVPSTEPYCWNYTFIFIGTICLFVLTVLLRKRIHWRTEHRLKKCGKDKTKRGLSRPEASRCENWPLFRRVTHPIFSRRGPPPLLAPGQVKGKLSATLGDQKVVEVCQPEGISYMELPCSLPTKADVKRSRQANKVTFALVNSRSKSPNIDRKTELKAKDSLTSEMLAPTSFSKARPARNLQNTRFYQKGCCSGDIQSQKGCCSGDIQSQFLTKTDESALPSFTSSSTEARDHKKSNLAPRQKLPAENNTYSSTTEMSAHKNIPKTQTNFRQRCENNESDSHNPSSFSHTRHRSHKIFSQSQEENKRRRGHWEKDCLGQSQRHAVDHCTLSSDSECRSKIKTTTQNMPAMVERGMPAKRSVNMEGCMPSTGSSECPENILNTEYECSKSYTTSSYVVTNAFSPTDSSETRKWQESSYNCQVQQKTYGRGVRAIRARKSIPQSEALRNKTYGRGVRDNGASRSQRLITQSEIPRNKTYTAMTRHRSKVEDLGSNVTKTGNYFGTRPVSRYSRSLREGRGRLKLNSGNEKQICVKSETTEDVLLPEITWKYNEARKNRSKSRILKHENNMCGANKKCFVFASRAEEDVHVIESLLSLPETRSNISAPTCTYHRDAQQTPAERSSTVMTTLSHGGRDAESSKETYTLCTSNLHCWTQSRDSWESSKNTRRESTENSKHPGNSWTQSRDSWESSKNTRRESTENSKHPGSRKTRNPEKMESPSFTTDMSRSVMLNKGADSLTTTTDNTKGDNITCTDMPRTLSSESPVKNPHLNKSVLATRRTNLNLTNHDPDQTSLATRRTNLNLTYHDPDQTSLVLSTSKPSIRAHPTLFDFLNSKDTTNQGLNERGKLKSKMGGNTEDRCARKMPIRSNTVCIQNPFFENKESFVDEMKQNKCNSDNEFTSVSISETAVRKEQNLHKRQVLLHVPKLNTQEIKTESEKEESLIFLETTVSTNTSRVCLKKEALSSEKVKWETFPAENIASDEAAVDSALITIPHKDVIKMSQEKLLKNNDLNMPEKRYSERVTMRNLRCIHKLFTLNSASDKITAVTMEEVPVGQRRGENGGHNTEELKDQTVFKSSQKEVSISKDSRAHNRLENDKHSALDEALKMETSCNKEQTDKKLMFHENAPCPHTGCDKTINKRKSHIPTKKSRQCIKTIKPGQTCALSNPEGRIIDKTESIKKDQILDLPKATSLTTKTGRATSHHETIKNCDRGRRQGLNHSAYARTHQYKSKVALLAKRKARSFIPVRRNIRNKNELGEKVAISSSHKTEATTDLKVYPRPVKMSATSTNEHLTNIPSDVVNVKPNNVSVNSGFKPKPLMQNVNTTLKKKVSKHGNSYENIQNYIRSHPQEKPLNIVAKRNCKLKEILANYLVHTVEHHHKPKFIDSDKHVQQTQNADEESPRSSSTDPVLSNKSMASASSLERPDVLRKDESSYTTKYKSHEARSLTHSWRGTNAFRKRLQCLLQHNKNTRKYEKNTNKKLLLAKGMGRGFLGLKDVDLISARKDMIKTKLLSMSETLSCSNTDHISSHQSASKSNKNSDKRSKHVNGAIKRKCDQPSNVSNDNDNELNVDHDTKTLNSSLQFEDVVESNTFERKRNRKQNKNITRPVCLLDAIKTNINNVPPTKADDKSLSDVSSRSLITELGRQPRGQRPNQNAECQHDKRLHETEELPPQTAVENVICKNSHVSSNVKCKTRSQSALTCLQRAHSQSNKQLVNVFNSWIKKPNADLDTANDQQRKVGCEVQDLPSHSCRYCQNREHAEAETIGLSKWDQLSCNDKGILDMRMDADHFDVHGREDCIVEGETIKSRGTMTDNVSPSSVIARSERGTSDLSDVPEKNAIKAITACTTHEHVVRKSVRPFVINMHKVHRDSVRKHRESSLQKQELGSCLPLDYHNLIELDSCLPLDYHNLIEDSTGITKRVVSNFKNKRTLSCTDSRQVSNYSHDYVVKNKAHVSTDSSLTSDVKSCPVGKSEHNEVNKIEPHIPVVETTPFADLLRTFVNVQDTPKTVISANEHEETLARDSNAKIEWTELLVTSKVKENGKSSDLHEQTTNVVELRRRCTSPNESQTLQEVNLHSDAAEESLHITTTECSTSQLKDCKSKTIKVGDGDIQELNLSDNQNNGHRPRRSARFIVPTLMSADNSASFTNSFTVPLGETARAINTSQPAEVARSGNPEENKFPSGFNHLQKNWIREKASSTKKVVNPQSESLYDTLPPVLQDLENDIDTNDLSVLSRQENIILGDSDDRALAVASMEDGVDILEKDCPLDVHGDRKFGSEDNNGAPRERNHLPSAQIKHHSKESVRCRIEKWTKIQEQYLNKHCSRSFNLFNEKGNNTENIRPILRDADLKKVDGIGSHVLFPTKVAQINHRSEPSYDKMNASVAQGVRHNYCMGLKTIRKPGQSCRISETSNTRVLTAIRDAGASITTDSASKEYKNFQSLVNDTAPRDVVAHMKHRLKNVAEIALENSTGSIPLKISSRVMFASSKQPSEASPLYQHQTSNDQTESFRLQNIPTESNQLIANVSTAEDKKCVESCITFKMDADTKQTSPRDSGMSPRLLSSCLLEPVAPPRNKELYSTKTRLPSWTADSNHKVSDISVDIERVRRAVIGLTKWGEQGQPSFPATTTASQITASDRGQSEQCPREAVTARDRWQSYQGPREAVTKTKWKPSEQTLVKQRKLDQALSTHGAFTKLKHGTLLKSNIEEKLASIMSKKQTEIKSWATHELMNNKIGMINELKVSPTTNQLSKIDKLKVKAGSLPSNDLSSLKKQQEFVSPNSLNVVKHKQNKRHTTDKVVSKSRKCVRKIKSSIETIDFGLKEPQSNATVAGKCVDIEVPKGTMATHKDDNPQPPKREVSVLSELKVKKQTRGNTKEEVSTAGRASADIKDGFQQPEDPADKKCNKECVQQHKWIPDELCTDNRNGDRKTNKTENLTLFSQRHEHNLQHDKHSLKRQHSNEAHQDTEKGRSVLNIVDDLESLLNKELGRSRIDSRRTKERDAIFNFQHESGKRSEKRKRVRNSCSPLSCQLELHYHYLRENDGSIKGTSSSTSQQTAVCTSDTTTCKPKRPRKLAMFTKLEEFIQRAEEVTKNKQDCSIHTPTNKLDFNIHTSGSKHSPVTSNISSNQTENQRKLQSEATDNACRASDFKKRKLDSTHKGYNVATKTSTGTVFPSQIMEVDCLKSVRKQLDECIAPGDIDTGKSNKAFRGSSICYKSLLLCRQAYTGDDVQRKEALDTDNEDVDSLMTQMVSTRKKRPRSISRERIGGRSEIPHISGRRLNGDIAKIKSDPSFKKSGMLSLTQSQSHNQAQVLTVPSTQNDDVINSLSSCSSSIVLSWFDSDVVDTQDTMPNSPIHSDCNVEKLQITGAHSTSHVHP